MINILRKKSNTRKDFLSDTKYKKSLTDLNDLCFKTLQYEKEKQKIKNEISSFVKTLRIANTKIEMKNYFSIIYSDCYISVTAYINEKQKEEEAHLVLVSYILTFVKFLDIFDIFLSKEFDMHLFINNSVSLIHQCSTKKINNELHRNLSCIVLDLVSFFEMKVIKTMVEEETLMNFISDDSTDKLLRSRLYYFLLKFFSNSKSDVILKNYIEENKCLESEVSVLEKEFMKENLNSSELFVEILNLCLIYNLSQNTISVSKSSFPQKVANVFIFVFEKILAPNFNSIKLAIKYLYLIDYCNKDLVKAKLGDFSGVSDLYGLIDMCHSLEIIRNDMTTVLLYIFQINVESDTEMKIRKEILCTIFKDISMTGYKFIIQNTNFINVFVERIHTFPMDIIISYFNLITVLYENQCVREGSSNSVNKIERKNSNIPKLLSSSTPLSEIRRLNSIPNSPYRFCDEISAIVKLLSKIPDEETLQTILKQFQTLLNLSSSFQKIIGSNDYYFSQIKEILDLTLKQRSVQIPPETPFITSSGSKYQINKVPSGNFTAEPLRLSVKSSSNERISVESQYTIGMLEELLDFTVQLIKNNKENISKIRTSGIIDVGNYIKYVLSNYKTGDRRKLIVYKLWSIAVIYDEENKSKNVHFIVQRYKTIFDNFLGKVCDSDNPEENLGEKVNNFIEEVIVVNEAIMKCLRERKSTLENEMLEVVKNFPELLAKIKNKLKNVCKPKTRTEVTEFTLEENSTTLKSEEEIETFWDAQKQDYLKKYLKNLISIVQISNKQVLNNVFKKKSSVLSHALSTSEFNLIIRDLFSILSDEYILDIIKYLIDTSFKFSSLSGSVLACSPINFMIFRDDLTEYYKSKFKLTDEVINDSKKQRSLYSNIVLHSPFILVSILAALKENKKAALTSNFINFLVLITSLNENNCKGLLLSKVLNYTQDLELYKNLIKHFSAYDINQFFIRMLYKMKQSSKIEKCDETIIEQLKMFHSSYNNAHKQKRKIILSNANTKQINSYNLLYSTGINLYDKDGETSYISVIISLNFFSLDDSTFILFKLDKDTKNQAEFPVVEILIEKKNLVVKSKENIIFKTNVNSLIPDKKTVKFNIKLYKKTKKLEIYLNERNILRNFYEFPNFLEDQDSTYNIIVGYPGPTRDVYSESFNSLSHVALSYILIYNDLFMKEFSENFSLCKLNSSKNGSCCNETIYIRYLSDKTYKLFAPVKFSAERASGIDKGKVCYELICDDIDFITYEDIDNKKRQKNEEFLYNVISKMSKKYYIDISERLFIPIVYKSNTMLLSRDNTGDIIELYDIYDKNCQEFIRNNILSFNNTLDFNCRKINFIENVLACLNEVDSVQATKENKEKIVLQLLQVISQHLVNNINQIPNFSTGPSFKALMIVMIKLKDYLTQKSIDIIFNLSYGVNREPPSKVFEPWFPKYILDFILNFTFFDSLKNLQLYIISKLKPLSLSNEPNYGMRITLVNRLYHFLLSFKSTPDLDKSISDIIKIIMNQMFKCKKVIAPSSNHLREAVYNTVEFLRVSNNFNYQISSHLEPRNFTGEELNETTNIIKKTFSKLYDEEINSIREDIRKYFKELNDEFTTLNESTSSGINRGSKMSEIIAPIIAQNDEDECVTIENEDEGGNANNVYSFEEATKNENLSAGGKNIFDEFLNVGSSFDFCHFISARMKYVFNSLEDFSQYRKVLNNFYYNLCVQSDYDENIEKISQDEISTKYSYYVYNREGPFRIRNRLVKKLESKVKDTFFGCDEKIREIVSIDEICQLKFITKTIKKNDVFIDAFNSLLFKGLNNYICSFVLGKECIYIMRGIFVDEKKTMYRGTKDNFPKFFWGVTNYLEFLKSGCSYLNMKKLKEAPVFKRYIIDYSDITEIHKRKYLHQNNSLEIFTKKGKTFLFAFNKPNRENIFNIIIQNITLKSNLKKLKNHQAILPLVNSPSISFYLKKSKLVIKKPKTKQKRSLLDIKGILDEVQEKWSVGLFSNFDYIMLLNTISGRSYNDLSQYHIFPWTIKDYAAESINLNNNFIYRDFSYPIFAQDEKTRDVLEMKYSDTVMVDEKYHCGTHYSTPGFVTYYLIRMKPYSSFAMEIQGGYFDTADRLFSNIRNFWEIPDKYQELVPEVFFFPEIFININLFNFGMNQLKQSINDVELPLWCFGDPRLFSKMGKKAIESCFVSENISNWIDLVFGYKQNGKEAVDSFNIFRKACYPFDLDEELERELKKSSKEKVYEELENKMNEIIEMGENPIQLFTKPHIKKEKHQKNVSFFSKYCYLMNFKMKTDQEQKIKIVSNVNDIKSEYEISEYLMSHGEGGLSSFCSFVSDDNYTNNRKFCAVGKNKILLGPKFTNYIDFSEKNKYSFSIIKPKDKIIMEYILQSPVSVIKASNDGRHLYIGYTDGCIEKFKLYKEEEKIIHPDFEKGTLKKKKFRIPKLLTKIKNDTTNSLFKYNKKTFNVSTPASIINEAATSGQNPGSNSGTGGKEEILRRYSIKSIQSFQSKSNQTYDQNNQTGNLKGQNGKIYPTITFITNEDLNDYYLFSLSNKEVEPKSSSSSVKKKDLSKGSHYYTLRPLAYSTSIFNPISQIELCEPFNTLFVIDSEGKIFLFNAFSLKVLHIIPSLSLPIISLDIVSLTGDFSVSTDCTVSLYSINTVPLARLDITSEISKGTINEITSSYLTELKSTESDVYLFTGHSDGKIIIWKLETNCDVDEFGNKSSRNDTLETYYTKFNKKLSKITTSFPTIFTKLITLECKNSPIVKIKLIDNQSNMIVINSDNTLLYLTYSEYIESLKKKKNVKKCPVCSSSLGKSKICCIMCNKKLCSSCKIEEKIPEYSIKNKKPICEDCLGMFQKANKLLYDF